MRAPLLVGLVAALASAGAAVGTPRRAPAGPEAPRSALARGAALMAAGECGRCHELTGLPTVATAPRERSCAGCHAWIQGTAGDPAARARARREYPSWDRYLRNVRSFLVVPDLGLAAARLDPRWVARYLRAPYDVRPGLPEEMIRTAWTEQEAHDAATWLVTTARAQVVLGEAARAAAAVPLSAAAEDVEAGAVLFARLACSQCHALGARPATPGLPGAPDLAHTARRMRPDDVAALLVDPGSFGIEARMPRYQLTAPQAARLRDFLFASAAADDRSPAPPPPDLPLLSRAVRYAEVRARVLAPVCVHCHMDPARNVDGGPGNTGGLTYAGVALDLESWRGIARGALRDGRRHSVLARPQGGGEPLLVARLRARFAEHAREQAGPGAVLAGGAPGMPLGLPPLSAADFQLVRSWVAQGAPGPERR